jgi:hypothetical protein
MRGVVLVLVPIACCLSAASALGATDPWKGAIVFPKSAQLRLVDHEGRDFGSVIQIEWPARVERINGQWLLVRDSGGYSVPPYAGWVRKSEMLRLSRDGAPEQRWEDPRSYYTDKIEENHAATDVRELHWLRGIYSESQGETNAAIEDYCLAAGAALPPACRQAWPKLTLSKNGDPVSASPAQDTAPSFVASDAILRLGRLLAQRDSSDATCLNDAAWQEAFSKAETSFAASGQGSPGFVPPILFLEWGVAATGRYKSILHPHSDKDDTTDGSAATHCDAAAPQPFFEMAQTKLQHARELNGGWSKPYFNLGELYLAQGTAKPKEKPKVAALPNGQPTVKNPTEPVKNPLAPTPAHDAKKESNGVATKQNPAIPTALKNAVTAFDYAIRVDPSLKEAYRERARAYYFQAEPPKAEEAKPAKSNDKEQAAGKKSAPCPEAPKDKSSNKSAAVKSRPTEKERLLRKAADSAQTACDLSYYLDAPSLELLADIIGDLAEEIAHQQNLDAAAAYYDQAAYFAESAAVLATDPADKARLRSLKDSFVNCKNCPGSCKPPEVSLEQRGPSVIRSRPSFTE